MKPDEIDPPSPFSVAFAAAFREIADDSGVKGTDIAREIDRTKAYVSERMTGLRAVDTDMIDALASLIGTNSGELVRRIVRNISDSGHPL